jgi:hypothetical protein
MFGFTRAFVIPTPTGKYTYVGRVPIELTETKEPTKADIMAGRWYKTDDGRTMSYRILSFDTEAEAIEFAANLGIEVGLPTPAP